MPGQCQRGHRNFRIGWQLASTVSPKDIECASWINWTPPVHIKLGWAGAGLSLPCRLCLGGGTIPNSSLFRSQVQLGEEEPEDIAVRRFMKAVMDSKLLDKVRGHCRAASHTGSPLADAQTPQRRIAG